MITNKELWGGNVDMTEDFIFTTASSLEGYKIIRQCGLVFGETVFKHGFLSRLGAAINNIGFGTREFEGSVDLIEKARDFAYQKMKADAISRGANAIIAIDSDNTFGGEIMYLSLYGTAVKVVSEKDYEQALREEQAQQVKAEAERIMAESRAHDLQSRRNQGDDTPEDQFLREAMQKATVSSIYETWKKYDLKGVYPEIEELLSAKASTESKFGALTGTQFDNIKDKIRELLHAAN